MKTKDEIILDIARRHFRMETLETRKSDNLDFKEIAVWEARDALIEAFEAGQKITANKDVA